MAAFLILVGSVVVGVLVCRWLGKRGTGAAPRRVAGVAAGFLLFAVLAIAIAPDTEHAAASTPAAAAAAVATAAADPPNPIPSNGQLDDGGPSGLDAPASAVAYAAPRYPTLTPESRRAARSYIARIDAEIKRSVSALPTADLQVAGNFSRQFGRLADEGMAQFGRLGEPLGVCTLAGAQAQQLWLSKLVTHDPTPADIQQAATNAQDYREYRARCLASAKG